MLRDQGFSLAAVRHLFLSFHVRMMMVIIRGEDRPQMEQKGGWGRMVGCRGRDEQWWYLWYGMLHHMILVSFMQLFDWHFIRKIVRNALLSSSIFHLWVADTLMHFGKCGARTRTKQLQVCITLSSWGFSPFYPNKGSNIVTNIFFYIIAPFVVEHSQMHLYKHTHTHTRPHA